MESFLTHEYMEKRRVTPAIGAYVSSFFLTGKSMATSPLVRREMSTRHVYLALITEFAEFGSAAPSPGEQDDTKHSKGVDVHANKVLRASCNQWLSFISQVLLGIVALGRCGVAHNDLKLDNVLFTKIDEHKTKEARFIVTRVPASGKKPERLMRLRVHGNCLYTLCDFGMASVESWTNDPRALEAGSLSANYYDRRGSQLRRLDELRSSHANLVEKEKKIAARAERLRRMDDIEWQDVGRLLFKQAEEFDELRRSRSNIELRIQKTENFVEMIDDCEERTNKYYKEAPLHFNIGNNHVIQYENIGHYEREVVFFLNRVAIISEKMQIAQHLAGNMHAAENLRRVYTFARNMCKQAYRKRLRTRDEQMLFVIDTILSPVVLNEHFGAEIDANLFDQCEPGEHTPIIYEFPTLEEGKKLEAKLIEKLAFVPQSTDELLYTE